MSLPLTLLTGAATALRDDLLRCLVLRRPALVAVRYDVAVDGETTTVQRVVLDARGVQSTSTLPLVDCCFSCTVRDDAAPAVGVLAYGQPEQIVLALPASLSPQSLNGTLYDIPGVRCTTVSTLVEAPLLRAQVSGSDLLAERGMAAAPTDRRSTAELICSQLEQADVVGVAGLPRLGTERARTADALLAHLAPLARRVELGPGGAGCDELLGHVPEALGRRGPEGSERDRLAFLAADLCSPSCGVQTLRWRSTQALHPVRLREAMPRLITDCVRGRGLLLLGGRTDRAVRWSSAGASLSIGDESVWQGEPATDLLLTGVGFDPESLRALLQWCLATPEELAAPLVDPFANSLDAPHG